MVQRVGTSTVPVNALLKRVSQCCLGLILILIFRYANYGGWLSVDRGSIPYISGSIVTELIENYNHIKLPIRWLLRAVGNYRDDEGDRS